MERKGGKPPGPNWGGRAQNLGHREILDDQMIAKEEVSLTLEEHWTSSTMGKRSHQGELLSPHSSD